MFQIIGTFHITIGIERPKKNPHVIIVAKNNTLQIARMLVTRPRPRSPRMSVQLVRAVVDAMADAAVDVKVDAVVDTKVDVRSGATIIRIGIETIMDMVFKRGEMIGCAIDAARSVNGMPPIIMDFMLLGCVILELLS